MISDAETHVLPSLWLNYDLTLQSPGGNDPTLEVGESDSFPRTAAVTLNYLGFSIATARTALLFEGSGGALKLTLCLFELSVDLGYSLWSIGCGSLSMNSCPLSLDNRMSSPIFFISGSGSAILSSVEVKCGSRLTSTKPLVTQFWHGKCESLELHFHS